MDFKDLEHDKEMQKVMLNFKSSIDKIEVKLNKLLDKEDYEKLSVYDKVQYDIFTTYSLNTLFWLYLRTNGLDPNENDVKNELGRIRQYMIKAKQAHEHNTLRPRIDKAVAGRFIKHGIHNIDKEKNCSEPPSKRQKIEVIDLS